MKFYFRDNEKAFIICQEEEQIEDSVSNRLFKDSYFNKLD
jgi:hypothetical protein